MGGRLAKRTVVALGVVGAVAAPLACRQSAHLVALVKAGVEVE
jgi:hypothetical protein